MNDSKEHFQTFSDNRLIEIVRNAKQFGYDDKIRNAALQVLAERGISEEDLQLTGNLSNYKFDYARTVYNSYVADSATAFFSYAAFLVFKVIIIFHLVNIDPSGWFALVLGPVLFILFLLFLVKSFMDHLNFYKAIGRELGLGDQIIFFIIGMPLYVFMYFFYKKQMREEMRMIN